jgi:hypothetical protein
MSWVGINFGQNDPASHTHRVPVDVDMGEALGYPEGTANADNSAMRKFRTAHVQPPCFEKWGSMVDNSTAGLIAHLDWLQIF